MSLLGDNMSLFHSAYRFLLGYVRLTVSGEYSERLLNILSANRISFWEIHKKHDTYEICLLRRDFSRLRHLRRHTGVRVHIASRHGLPKIVRRYRLRFGIPVGAMVFFVILYYLSARLWVIDIRAPQRYDTSRAQCILQDLSVHIGMKMDELDTDTLRQQFIMLDPSVSWASFNRQGSVLQLNVSLQSEQKREEPAPCNLIASEDGVIVRNDVRSGVLLVQTGQTVSAGQVLVSGVRNEQGRNEFLHSAGEVYAMVMEHQMVNLPVKETVHYTVGEPKKRYAFKFFGVTIPLFLGHLKGSYESHTDAHTVQMFGGSIPLTVYTQHNTPLCEELLERNQESALADGRKMITDRLKEATDIQFLQESVTRQGDSFCYSCRVRYTKNIASVEKLKIIGEK